MCITENVNHAHRHLTIRPSLSSPACFRLFKRQAEFANCKLQPQQSISQQVDSLHCTALHCNPQPDQDPPDSPRPHRLISFFYISVLLAWGRGGEGGPIIICSPIKGKEPWLRSFGWQLAARRASTPTAGGHTDWNLARSLAHHPQSSIHISVPCMHAPCNGCTWQVQVQLHTPRCPKGSGPPSHTSDPSRPPSRMVAEWRASSLSFARTVDPQRTTGSSFIFFNHRPT